MFPLFMVHVMYLRFVCFILVTIGLILDGLYGASCGSFASDVVHLVLDDMFVAGWGLFVSRGWLV